MYKQPPSRSVKSLKKGRNYTVNMSLLLPIKQRITWSLFENDTTKDQLLVHHINTLTKINVKIDKCELYTFYWLPKLHKRPYKSRFISNSSHCSTTILSKHITFALTAVKDHVMKYSETAFSNSNVNYFWSIKTLPRSSKNWDCVTFRVLKYLLSTFLLYTPHCQMILSKQKSCLWLG